jgi:hypothetical protein
MKGGADRGRGGDDDDNGIDKHPVWAAMAMVMARATTTVEAAAGHWQPQLQPRLPLQWHSIGNGNGNGVSCGSSGNDDGGNKEGNKDVSKPGHGEGGILLTRQTREAMPITVALQAA